AVTLRADNGAEILLHVGIDTVGLAGEGFELHVREGQRVRAGDRLVSFDLELLAQRARSLVTPVVVTDTMGFAIARRSQNCSLNVGDFLMEISAAAQLASTGAGPTPSAVSAQAGGVVEANVLVLLEHGIHARPAASMAAAVKALASEVVIIFGER